VSPGWATVINLAGSAVLAFTGSWLGSYWASRKATTEVEQEQEQ
jgi:hypothetical protein